MWLRDKWSSWIHSVGLFLAKNIFSQALPALSGSMVSTAYEGMEEN